MDTTAGSSRFSLCYCVRTVLFRELLAIDESGTFLHLRDLATVLSLPLDEAIKKVKTA